MAETTRRRDAATATVGLSGVGAAGALRHHGLERAYPDGKRPPVLQELKFLRRKVPGRKLYAAGAAAGLLSVPPAAVGTARLLSRKQETAKRDGRKSFLEEGLYGVKDSLSERVDTATNPAPAKLMAANYTGGALIGSAAGGATHFGLRKTKLAGTGRAAALASMAGVATGAATLPAQSKLIERASKGKYIATPTGVRRKKTRAVRPSQQATVVDGRPGKSHLHPHALREQMSVGKMSPGQLVRTLPRAYNEVGARAGAHWTVQGLRAADKIDVPDRRVVPKTSKGKLVHTGRTKAANVVRSASLDVSSLNDKDALARQAINGHPLIGKRDGYYGQDLSSGQKRARVMATNTVPVLGDFAAASAAASMAPPELRKKTAALQFGGSQAGQIAGSAAGAYGLVRASQHAKVKPAIDRASDGIDGASNAIRSAVGMKPRTGPNRIDRVIDHKRTPGAVRGALRPLAKNPKAAAVGMLAGGMAGTQTGGYMGYGHALSLERERNARLKGANPAGRSGVGKRAAGMTSDDHEKQARKKRLAANVATFTGLTGTGALAALGGSKVLRARGAVKGADKLERYQTPLLTAGAGVGGLGSFNFAGIQRKEAKAEQAQVKKALIRVPGPRAPRVRRGTIRQTRYGNGIIRTSTVRGGLA